MSQPLRSRRTYDHRIREIVCRTGNPETFRHLRIPRSATARWMARGRPSVVTLDWEQEIALVLDENELMADGIVRRVLARSRSAHNGRKARKVGMPPGTLASQGWHDGNPLAPISERH